MASRTKIQCAACGKRIRDHQSDLILEDLEDDRGRPRYFHSRCGAAAYAAAAQEPVLYRLTHRYIEGVMN
jgi:hypothetical protein